MSSRGRQPLFAGLNGRIICDGERANVDPGPPPPGGPPNSEFSNRSEIYSMNPDGSDVRLLTNNAAPDNDPAVSADGTKIVFDSRRSTSFPTAHTMNADGTAARRLVTIPGTSFETSWSPDGDNVVFMDGSRASFDISRVKADGSGYTPLTSNPAQEGRPAWSPDGMRIVFTSGRDGNFEVFTMNPELGEPGGITKVTNTDPPVQNTMPQWSPDGRRITFATSRDAPGGPSLGDDNLEIYTMNADGSDPRRLTDSATNDPATGINEAFDERPSYSPDGTKIVFNSRRTGDAEVYTMNAADGSGLTRLTNTPGFDLRCDWAQVPPATVYPPVPVTPPVTPPRRAKHRTSLTLNARPRRDRRPPFRFTFSGRVRIPRGVSAAAVCGGRVRLVLRKGRRTVARGAARVSRGCTYRRRIAIRGTRRTGRRRARLRVTARYGGNASLSSSSRRSTTVRIF